MTCRDYLVYALTATPSNSTRAERAAAINHISVCLECQNAALARLELREKRRTPEQWAKVCAEADRICAEDNLDPEYVETIRPKHHEG